MSGVCWGWEGTGRDACLLCAGGGKEQVGMYLARLVCAGGGKEQVGMHVWCVPGVGRNRLGCNRVNF